MSAETNIDRVIIDLLTPLATASGLQLVAAVGDDTLDPQRIAVHTTDQGEDRSVKLSGRWGRRFRSQITLKVNAGDKTADWLEAISSQLFAAIQTPSINSDWSANFHLLVIQEIAESDLTMEKRNWMKIFVVTLTALPI